MPATTAAELTKLKIPKRYHHTVKSRLAVLAYVAEHGLKPTARRFGCDRKTVRTWHQRHRAAGLAGLAPRYPATRPRRISEQTVRLIEPARRDLEFGTIRTRIWLERIHRIRIAAATIRRSAGPRNADHVN
jgi:transposase